MTAKTLYNKKELKDAFRVKHDTEMSKAENHQIQSGPKHRKESSDLRHCLKASTIVN